MSQSSITRFAGQVMHWLVNATFLVKVPMVRTEAVLEFLLSVPASLSRRGVDGSAMATITLDILIYSCGIPLILATPRPVCLGLQQHPQHAAHERRRYALAVRFALEPID